MAAALDRPRPAVAPAAKSPTPLLPDDPVCAAERAGKPGALSLERLTLTDFRGYARLTLATDPRPVVLTGPNGAGKTNLLEAISFLTPGRGLRRARLSEADRIGGGGPWAVAARLRSPAGEEVAIGTGRDPEGERRLVRIDGEPRRRQADLAGAASVVWLTPAMDRLFEDSASGRRRFLDRLVFTADPAHAEQVSAYERALRERSRLLRTRSGDPAWLAALERRAAAAGVAVAAARREVVRGLGMALAAEPGPFPRPGLAVAGEVEGWLDAGEPALAAELRLRAALAASRRQDAETGGAALGPHRSDLVVVDAEEQGRPAAMASTGRQKALLISIVLAEARLRAARGAGLPVLLLDEVAAHLDPTRRRDLFDALSALGAQAWLTGTDALLFEPLRGAAQFFTVKDANLA